MKAIGCKSVKTFYKLKAWVAVQGEFKKGRSPKPTAVSLTPEMEVGVETPDSGELARLIKEQERERKVNRVNARDRI
jgi:hypothetical protein